MSAPIVAVIGGGQLARMMQEEASALGIHLRALVEAADGSTGQVTPDAPVGAAHDEAAVRAVVAGDGTDGLAGEGAAVLTFEHEHQDSALLERLQSEGVSVQPTPQALTLARDKLAMRRMMSAAGLPQPAWAEIGGPQQEGAEQMADAVEAFADEHGWPVVLKTPRGGYDGHGVLLVRSAESLREGEAAEWITSVARARAGQGDGRGAGGGGSLGGAAVTSLLVEQAIPFTRELAVLLARTPSGQVAVWPVAQTVQEDGMCAEVLAPAPGLDSAAIEEAELIGRTVAERAEVTGVLAVELFAVEAFGEPTRLYVNELAMRPHNSGHWTQDGAVTSQFAQHLRAVLDLPLGATDATAPTTVMVNLIGGRREPGADALARAMAAHPEARIHLYGKQWRAGRKLGHVTMTVGPDQEVADVVEQARGAVAILRGDA
ncbi:5-(carboxyamino)imidazole ribonucleotide synthase [Actinomyces oris]|uniref:5-(carboxyamino)imidazole ribonucleotide synthase n=1 Tax=Actinomyces oris TaxID=544580 RepID=UPI00094DAD8C|nr:ATP-grasp domain-containing protein [Actinomyces oris]OLO61750.1 phosphoheptose isomerase [Actinomyces oris]